MHIFKVGDKVKFLSTALEEGVPKLEVEKEGVVEIVECTESIGVRTDGGYCYPWYVMSKNIVLVERNENE